MKIYNLWAYTGPPPSTKTLPGAAFDNVGDLLADIRMHFDEGNVWAIVVETQEIDPEQWEKMDDFEGY